MSESFSGSSRTLRTNRKDEDSVLNERKYHLVDIASANTGASGVLAAETV